MGKGSAKMVIKMLHYITTIIYHILHIIVKQWVTSTHYIGFNKQLNLLGQFSQT